MKKGLFVLCAVMMTLFFAQPVFAGPSIDQQFTGGTGSLAIKAKQRMVQRFLPSMTGLSKVEIELANVGADQKVSVTIRHKTGLNWDEADVASVLNQTAVNGWNTFDFPDVTVIKDGWYGIFVTAADYEPQWKYSSGPSTYDRGYAIFDSNDYVDADFNFKTWGTNPVEIVEEQTQPGGDPPADTLGSTDTTVAGEAPAAAVSSTIAKPTGLKAEFAAGGKLTWSTSTTTDITGYMIFRSEIKGSGYEKIGQTTKAVLEYLDTTTVAGKTYYYVVRAYKNTVQSASSNEASLVIPAAAGPIKPQNLKIISSDIDNIIVGWDKNPETNIAQYILVIMQGDTIVKTVATDTTKTGYVFDGLTADTTYTIKLTAKDTSDRESEAAQITAETAAIASGNSQTGVDALTWWLIGSAGVLTAALIALIIVRRRRQKIV